MTSHDNLRGFDVALAWPKKGNLPRGGNKPIFSYPFTIWIGWRGKLSISPDIRMGWEFNYGKKRLPPTRRS